uniref:Si:ch211-1e14.1 n=1 Tax=Sphaeramia orbicularis TaxID=375764 RepID=A0A673A0H5_9TELE
MDFLKDVPTSTGSSSPSALPTSHFTAFGDPDLLPSIPEPNHEAMTANAMQWEHVTLKNSKSFMPSDLHEEAPHPLPTPPISPSEPVLGSNPQLETFTKFSTDWKPARTNSTSSHSPTAVISQLQPQPNTTSLTPPTSSKSAVPQFHLTSEQTTPDALLSAYSEQNDGASEQNLPILTSLPGQPLLKPTKVMFPDYQADAPDPNQLLKASSNVLDMSFLSPSNDILAPSFYVPFFSPHPTSPLSEPTEVSPEEFFPTNTMDVDWGSGDYLETMSFLGSEGDDYSLVTKVPSDMYDLEDSTESYDTSFPSRVGISLSSRHPLHVSSSPSLMTAHSTIDPSTSIYLSSSTPALHFIIKPTPSLHSEIAEASDIDWFDTYTIEPTDVLLPDMNSLEYYTTQMKENENSDTGAEQRGNITMVPVGTTDIAPTNSSTDDTKLSEQESSSDLSGFEPVNETTTVLTTEESPQLVNVSGLFLDPSIATSLVLEPSSSVWGTQKFTTDWAAPTLTPELDSSVLTAMLPNATAFLPEVVISSSSFTDVHWFVTDEPFLQSMIYSTPIVTATIAFTPGPTEPVANTVASPTTEKSPHNTSITTELNLTTTKITATAEASTNDSIISKTSVKTPTTAQTSRQYLCRVDKPTYLVKISFPSGATIGYAKSQIRDILKVEFNKSVELQVIDPPPKFVFRVVSGPVVYTAISVVNSLRRSGRRFLSVSPNWSTPDNKYQVHTVLQFVPSHIDVRYCNFSESIERGLTKAFAEVCRRSKESTNFTVHVSGNNQALDKQPVDITFTVRGSRGYLMGSEVSNSLMKLTMVEFSYYMGFPVLQIAEPFHYPELNTSHLLRSSWVKTVLLGVLDQKVGERTFQANMERRVAMLLGEAMGVVRRVKRATSVGNSSVQIVSANRLDGTDHPMEIVYFVEGPSGQRVPAAQTANLLNSLDVQRAAIVLGYRVQGILAQPLEKVSTSPSESENTNLWIVIGVVIPLLVVIIIISILYWKLCRTDKLEFQPDAMTSIQQRQKLQAPSVKGFDFAKLHLGQQSKDDVMVIQEPLPSGPGPLPMSIKDGLSPSENGEIPTPISKNSASSTKASRSSRRRGRISPSDDDSVLSDHSSERELTEENLRGHATPSDGKQTRKIPINVLNGPPPMNGTNEQLSSASIFEHVDRMSRATDASRRLPNKVQLIAMQPMPVPPLHSPTSNGKLSDTNQINKEIQVALRHKSEIEHHRNKIRLRAKRKGHYDFPAMDDMTTGLGDLKDQDRIYQKAQMQIDKILDPDSQMPSIFMESKKSGRGRRSPKQRMKEQLNGGMMEADKDHLITEDSDAAYRKCPGVNNVAYVSDPDQGPGSPHRSPSPTDDVFLGPTSSPPGHAPPPPPYMPPQPSIEEARQQMHSLLDDAFALVSPTSQGSTAGITLPGVNNNHSSSSPPGRSARPWGSSYQALGPFPSRFGELSMSPPAVQGLVTRQGIGSSYLPPGEPAGHGEQLQPDSLYSSRGLYADELPSSARPRPVGGTTGAQLHHLTQVGLSSRMNGYPAGLRMPRSGIREPSAPPAHLDPPGVGYLSAPPPLDTAPSTHSSASLIKAIREELLRLSQKQSAVSSYHS